MGLSLRSVVSATLLCVSFSDFHPCTHSAKSGHSARVSRLHVRCCHPVRIPAKPRRSWPHQTRCQSRESPYAHGGLWNSSPHLNREACAKHPPVDFGATEPAIRASCAALLDHHEVPSFLFDRKPVLEPSVISVLWQHLGQRLWGCCRRVRLQASAPDRAGGSYCWG